MESTTVAAEISATSETVEVGERAEASTDVRKVYQQRNDRVMAAASSGRIRWGVSEVERIEGSGIGKLGSVAMPESYIPAQEAYQVRSAKVQEASSSSGVSTRW